MRKKYLGHAGFSIITQNDIKILIDPWFNSAFLESWYPYPDNSGLIDVCRDADYVFLSHEHEDHCDVEFLKSTNAQIFIPKFRSDSFRVKLNANGISFLELDPRKSFSIEEMKITFIIQSSPAWDDSAIAIECLATNQVFLNLNDLKPSVDDMRFMRGKFKKINFLAFQYSGASWHPMCNKEIEEKEKKKIISKKIKNKFLHTIKLIDELTPEVVLPSAGPPIFLNSKHLEFNNSITGVFPYLDEYLSFYNTKRRKPKILLLQPGDDVVLTHFNAEIVDSREKYYRSNSRDINWPKYDIPISKISTYFHNQWEDIGAFKNLLNYSIIYEISDTDFRFMVNPKAQLIEEVKANTVGDLILSLPSYVFQRIINGNTTWEEAFLSLHVAFEWNITYNEYIMTYHKYLHSDYLKDYLKNLANTRSNETFEIDHEGKRLAIQRVCPHAQGDLSKGEIVDGCIVCPSHGWRFDIKTGTCLDSPGRITIKEI